MTDERILISLAIILALLFLGFLVILKMGFGKFKRKNK